VKIFAASRGLPEGRYASKRICPLILLYVLYVVGLTALWLAGNRDVQSATGPHARIELIVDGGAGTGRTIWVGLFFRLDPGWHIYWQNPGDSGTPPKVNWHLPAGYRAGTLRWPTPIRLGHGSIVDYAYEGEVLLMAPIERAAISQGNPPPIAADVKYVVCSEVCIPGNAHLTLSLPSRDSAYPGAPSDPPEWHAAFARTRAQLPKPAPVAWKLSAASTKNDFVLSARTGAPVKNAAFFPSDPDEIENSAPQPFAETKDGFRLTLRKSEQLAKPVSTLRGLLVLGAQSSYEVAVPVVAR
jgi:DsbC/DsbD-like thiol-disulfide interchange protein